MIRLTEECGDQRLIKSKGRESIKSVNRGPNHRFTLRTGKRLKVNIKSSNIVPRIVISGHCKSIALQLTLQHYDQYQHHTSQSSSSSSSRRPSYSNQPIKLFNQSTNPIDPTNPIQSTNQLFNPINQSTREFNQP